jgi:hypothetical protein
MPAAAPAEQCTFEWSGVTTDDFLGDGNGGGVAAMAEQCPAFY